MEDQAYLLVVGEDTDYGNHPWSRASVLPTAEEAITLLQGHSKKSARYTPYGAVYEIQVGSAFCIATYYDNTPFSEQPSGAELLEAYFGGGVAEGSEFLSISSVWSTDIEDYEDWEGSMRWPVFTLQAIPVGELWLADSVDTNFEREEVYGNAEKIMSFSIMDDVQNFSGDPEEVVWWHK